MLDSRESPVDGGVEGYPNKRLRVDPPTLAPKRKGEIYSPLILAMGLSSSLLC